MTYPSNSEPVAQDQLQSYFDRWRRLEDEKASISTDLKELFVEAKSNGFDSKAMRAAFRRKVESEDAEMVAKAEEFDAIVDLYLSAISGTPLATRAGRARTTTEGDEIGEREGDEIRSAGDEGNSGGSDSEDQRGLHGATAERSEPAGDSDPAASGDEASAEGHTPDPQLAREAEGLVLPPVAPANKQWKYTDKPHSDCLDPAQCGGFSNLGLCQRCKDAAAGVSL